MVTVELLCEKLNITDKRTVNQILANKELSEEIARIASAEFGCCESYLKKSLSFVVFEF